MSGYETFAGHFSSRVVPPSLLEDIYEHLSKGECGGWVLGMPVLHGVNLLGIYGLEVKGNARTWVCELAEKHGLPLPTTAELNAARAPGFTIQPFQGQDLRTVYGSGNPQ